MKALLLASAVCLVFGAPVRAQYATGESPYENFNHVPPERQAEAEAEQNRLRAEAKARAHRGADPKR